MNDNTKLIVLNEISRIFKALKDEEAAVRADLSTAIKDLGEYATEKSKSAHCTTDQMVRTLQACVSSSNEAVAMAIEFQMRKKNISLALNQVGDAIGWESLSERVARIDPTKAHTRLKAIENKN